MPRKVIFSKTAPKKGEAYLTIAIKTSNGDSLQMDGIVTEKEAEYLMNRAIKKLVRFQKIK